MMILQFFRMLVEIQVILRPNHVCFPMFSSLLRKKMAAAIHVTLRTDMAKPVQQENYW